MNKKLKVFLISIGVLILVLGVGAFMLWKNFTSTFLDFEGEYAEQVEIEEITVDGYSFLDRNANGALDVYEDSRASTAERVADVLAQMTLEEKIHLLKGSGFASALGGGDPGTGIPGAVGTIVPTPRLGIPTVYLSDGPAGLRILPTREGEEKTYYCTAFPIATLLASTWNEELVENIGEAMGNEAKEYGIDVILGPGANIHRHPLCGRNFEYYSEDPLLTGYMGAAIVNGIESNTVGTSVKHYVANNQETDRFLNDVNISERALREIYLKGFELVVKKSQPWSIMSSYNKVNGTYASEDKFLLTEVLRDDWGFEGLVMTDWFGGKNPAAQISAGNDLLEPGTNRQWKALTEAAENGDLPIEDIDLAASRILSLVFKSRKMQNYAYANNPDLKAHAEITRQSAAEGMVLLKNDGSLPLQNIKNIALLGTTSYQFITGGTGSGDVNEAYTISLEQGLENAGFDINEAAKNLFETHKLANPEAFKEKSAMEAAFNSVLPPEMSYTPAQLEEIVGSADIGILTIGRNAGEGGDRVEKDDFLLSEIELEVISSTTEAFQSVGKKLIVVLNVGGVVETDSWKAKPDAILLTWQGGQEGGNSAADVLTGKVTPSGKLPMTFPLRLADHASHANFPTGGGELSITNMLWGLMFPPEDKPESEQIRNRDFTHYDEGIYVGYRHFDKNEIDVSYPFGYGLSYTNFEYEDLQVSVANDTLNLSLTVKNTGTYPGKEIIQLYAEKVSSTVDRPRQELRAFTKTKTLEAGATEAISIQLPTSDLAYWDEESSKWTVENGSYQIHIGASSRDIRLTGEIDI